MSYVTHNLGDIGLRLAQHVELTLTALVIACAIALPVGIFAARRPKVGGPLLAVLGVIYTLPSLAVVAILTTVIGLGFVTAIVALVAYAQMILVRNVTIAIRDVPAAMTDAARGLGMSPAQVFRLVELPLALPTMLAGLRIAAVTTIAIATLGGKIDAGGLGTLLFEGISQDNTAKIVTGSVAAALLAIVVDRAVGEVARRAARR
jgi:osmoprotectant transport system permease protein